jgi:hypothetical protein
MLVSQLFINYLNNANMRLNHTWLHMDIALVASIAVYVPSVDLIASEIVFE